MFIHSQHFLKLFTVYCNSYNPQIVQTHRLRHVSYLCSKIHYSIQVQLFMHVVWQEHWSWYEKWFIIKVPQNILIITRWVWTYGLWPKQQQMSLCEAWDVCYLVYGAVMELEREVQWEHSAGFALHSHRWMTQTLQEKEIQMMSSVQSKLSVILWPSLTSCLWHTDVLLIRLL